jgi:hypothetical protein
MDTKKWYKSTTIQGQIITVLSLVATWTNLTEIILPEEIKGIVVGSFALVGIGTSVYGRIKTRGEKLSK